MNLTVDQEATRATAIKEYFSPDELNIIHHALRDQLLAWETLKGYTIYSQTENLLKHAFKEYPRHS